MDRRPLIAGTRGFGLLNLNGKQRRKERDQPLRQPKAELLARRVLEPGDVVEAGVIERSDQRLGNATDVAEVHDPTEVGINRATQVEDHAVRMAMHRTTGMA